MNENEQKIIDTFEKSLKEARMNGISTGAKAICKVVLEKIGDVSRDEKKSELIKKLRDVQQFCFTGLGKEE